MPAHLRVSLPDRPGALAALTTALARVGTNLLSVAVVDREHGRAVDDLILDWPFERRPDALIDAVERCDGTRVHGLRHVLAPAISSDADLLTQILDAPQRAVETVVDSLPSVLLADWCATFDRQQPTRVVYSTPDAPVPLPLTAGPMGRAHAAQDGPESLIVAEVPGIALRVLVGRVNGPAFTRGEVDRCAALLTVTSAAVRLAYRETLRTSPTPVTAHLAAAAQSECYSA